MVTSAHSNLHFRFHRAGTSFKSIARTMTWTSTNSENPEKNLLKPKNSFLDFWECPLRQSTVMSRDGVLFQHISNASCTSSSSTRGDVITPSLHAGIKKNAARRNSALRGNFNQATSAGSSVAPYANVPRTQPIKANSRFVDPVIFSPPYWSSRYTIRFFSFC